jgi:hypothetical protein
MEPKAQIVVFKGIEGWCDRLQVLAHCIQYCLSTKATLCVDWSDYVWRGAEDFDFYDCFVIKGVKTMTKDEFCLYVDEERDTPLTITPDLWTLDLLLDTPVDMLNNQEIGGPLMKPREHTDACEVIEEDIVVTNGTGYRVFHAGFITEHIRVTPKLRRAILHILKEFDPDLLTVHLRGTDRPDADGTFDQVLEGLKKSPQYANAVINVVTDAKELWERFKEEFPKAKLVNPNAHLLRLPGSKHGIHRFDGAFIEGLGITKWDMLVDLMADWFALCYAKLAIGRTESTFFAMARRIHETGPEHLPKMLGWVPYSCKH